MTHPATAPHPNPEMLRLPATLALVLALVVAPWLAAQSPHEPADVKELDWGKTPNVTQLGTLFFAGQIDEEGLQRAKDAGVTLVLNLRSPDEHDWDEESAVEGAGLQYANVPITGAGFTPDAVAEIEALVKEHQAQGVLVHCASSNRVGGWLTTHMVTQHGEDLETALEFGRRAGMKSPAVEKRARDYLDGLDR